MSIIIPIAECVLWCCAIGLIIAQCFIIKDALRPENLSIIKLENHVRKSNLSATVCFLCLAFVSVLQLIEVCETEPFSPVMLVIGLCLLTFNIIMSIYTFYRTYNNKT